MAAGKTDWEKIGAIAGVLSVIVALVALRPSHSPSPGPQPNPAYSPTYTPEPGPPTRHSPEPSPTLAIPATMPNGCTEAHTAIQTYNRTVGTTQASKAAAANQAYSDMMGADTEADSSSVYTILVALAHDFQNLYFIASGQLDQSYSEAAAHTKSDVNTLNSICAPA